MALISYQILILMVLLPRGFAVVFAEDVPDVKTLDAPTGKLEYMFDCACNDSTYYALLLRGME
jgi:hypothetical protein